MRILRTKRLIILTIGFQNSIRNIEYYSYHAKRRAPGSTTVRASEPPFRVVDRCVVASPWRGGGQNTRWPAQSVRAGNRSGSDTSRDSVPTCTVFCFVTVSCLEILGECLFGLTDKLLCHCCMSLDKHTQIMSHRGSFLRWPVCLFVLFMRVIFETYLFFVFCFRTGSQRFWNVWSLKKFLNDILKFHSAVYCRRHGFCLGWCKQNRGTSEQINSINIFCILILNKIYTKI